MSKTKLGFYHPPLTMNEKDQILEYLIPIYESQALESMSAEVQKRIQETSTKVLDMFDAVPGLSVFREKMNSELRQTVRNWVSEYPRIRELRDSDQYYCRVGELNQDTPSVIDIEFSPAFLEMFAGQARFKPDITSYYPHSNDSFLADEMNQHLIEKCFKQTWGSPQEPTSFKGPEIPMSLLSKYNGLLFKLADDERDNIYLKRRTYDFTPLLIKFAKECLSITSTEFYPELLSRYDAILDQARPLTGADCDTEHLHWMLEQLRSDTTMSDTKKHRWLGFIQGVLVKEGLISVQEERDFTRDIFKGK